MTEPWLTVKQGDTALLVSFPHTGLRVRGESGGGENEGGGDGEQLSHDFLRRFSAWRPAGLP